MAVLDSNWTELVEEYLDEYMKKYGSIYAGIKRNAKELILKYYQYRTINIFNNEYPNYKFKVNDDAKLEKMLNVAEDADDWVFGGIIDLGSVCGHCTLGHALRYEYTAISRKLNKEIVFGSKCASDFFDIPRTVMSRLASIQNSVADEIKEILYILYTDNKANYKGRYYNDFPMPFMGDAKRAETFESFVTPDLIQMVVEFLKCGLPLTRYMYRQIADTKIIVTDKLEREERHEKAKQEYDEKFKEILGKYAESRRSQVKDILSEDINRLCFTQKKIVGILISETGVNLTDDVFRVLVGTFSFLDRDRVKIQDRLDDNQIIHAGNYTKFNKIRARKSETEYGCIYDANGYPIPTYSDETGVSCTSYEFRYKKKIWEGLNALSYMYTGYKVALKCFYWVARSKDYSYEDTPEENERITLCAIGKVKTVFEMLERDDYLDAFKDEEIAQQMFIEKAQQINNTKRDGEEVLQESFESIYNKMKNNMNLIYDQNIVNMLKSFKYEKLSDKQKNYICNVYARIKNKINAGASEALECRLTGNDANLVTKILLLCDANKRRVALIIMRENNTIVSGYKIMPTDVGSVHNALLNTDGSKVVPIVITNADEVGSALSGIIAKFQRMFGKELNIINAKDVGIKINSPEYEVLEIRGEDETLARKYFKNEGVIDKFMIRVARCLEENIKLKVFVKQN